MEVDDEFLVCPVQFLQDQDPFSRPNLQPTKPQQFRFRRCRPLNSQLHALKQQLNCSLPLDTCALQLCNYNVDSENQLENGNYLDIESSLDEQWEDFDLTEFSKQNKNVLLLRTSLQARCSACIQQLQSCQDRALRRALFSLKQLFQYDKELVHEFVNTDGLQVLINIGDSSVNESSNKNYILRALGQLMLYVDGMEGVRKSLNTISWLYMQCSSTMRLLIKTSLKLLLVFVEYNDANAKILIEAVKKVDKEQGTKAWSNFMKILKETDTEQDLLLYSITLLNKVLNSVPDQDTYYDIVDALEDQGMQSCMQKHIGNTSVPDLIEQFNIYEKVLSFEDGEESMPSIENVRPTPRKKSENDRVSKRKSTTGNSLGVPKGINKINTSTNKINNNISTPPLDNKNRIAVCADLKRDNNINNRKNISNGDAVDSTNNNVTNGSCQRRRRSRPIQQRQEIIAKDLDEVLRQTVQVVQPKSVQNDSNNDVNLKNLNGIEMNKNNNNTTCQVNLSDRLAQLRQKERATFASFNKKENRQRIVNYLTDKYDNIPDRILEMIDQHLHNDFVDLIHVRSVDKRRDALINKDKDTRHEEILQFFCKLIDEEIRFKNRDFSPISERPTEEEIKKDIKNEEEIIIRNETEDFEESGNF